MISFLKFGYVHVLVLLGVAFLHFRSCFYRSSPTEASALSQRVSKCPFTKMRQLLKSPTALFANSLLIPNPERAERISSSLLNEFSAWKHQYSRGNTALYFHPSGKHDLFDSYCHPSSSQLTATTIEAPTEVKHKKRKGNSPDNLEVVVLGLSHHNAKVDVREKLAIPEDQWHEVASKLCELDSIAEASVLSTCNRFEIYLAGTNQYEVMRDAITFLHNKCQGSLDLPTLRRNLFMLSGEDAIWHLLRVAAGLDSLVVGEGQILAQVKKAYEHSTTGTSPAGKVTARLLNTAVSAGKRVRSETGISKGAVSISSAAAEFSAYTLTQTSQNTLTQMSDANIVIIGAGKMARLLLIHLQTQGVKGVTVVNRSMQRIQELQQEFPDLVIHPALMPEMWAILESADIVYPSTASETTIIDVEELKELMEKRGFGKADGKKPTGLQLVDISVPRNVHPDCGTLEGVYSYNVDDLKMVVERNTMKRKKEMIEAEGILREELSKFRLWQQSLGAIPTIAKLQEKAESLRREEMSKAAKKLSALNPKDLETVEKVTKGIVAKLLHGPMNHLRQQTEGDATRAAIQQVQKAFQLNE
jgi:glutamyl-tRNA reductase